MTLFNLPNPARMHRAPMLVLGAECDPIIPPSLTDNDRTHAWGQKPAYFPAWGTA
jgi:hypothetical protein